MGLVSRMYNLWVGFISIFVGRMEEKHPEIAYENAINGMTEKYSKLKSAAAGLIKNRAQLEGRIQKAETELADIALQVETAVDQGEDEVALLLLERQDELNAELETARAELAQAAAAADSAKDSLGSIKAEIEKLKRERDKTVAKIKDAEARKQIQEQLDGLSIDDDVKALENVREYADKVSAEVQIHDELKEGSVENKLAKIRAQTGSARAKARLDALKKARSGASETPEAETTKTL